LHLYSYLEASKESRAAAFPARWNPKKNPRTALKVKDIGMAGGEIRVFQPVIMVTSFAVSTPAGMLKMR
jgi:hypothetical protein